MTPQFAVGDRVVIQGFAVDVDGREGTVTEAEFSTTRVCPYRVRIDNDPNWDGMDGRLFTADELIAVSKPEPEPGTLIRVVGPAGSMLHHSHIGKVGKVVARPDYVRSDEYDVFMDDGTGDIPLALDADEYEIVKGTPASQFAPGDRVVYTIPEMYLGYPGKNSAVRPAGSKGTVTEVFDSEAVNVNWDDYGLVNVATAFLAHAPKLTHKYPEGLYRGSTGERVFVQHEVAVGRYRLTYLDALHYRTDTLHINRNLSETVLDFYTLIAEAPKA